LKKITASPKQKKRRGEKIVIILPANLNRGGAFHTALGIGWKRRGEEQKGSEDTTNRQECQRHKNSKGVKRANICILNICIYIYG
jgi:hypothetical protein